METLAVVGIDEEDDGVNLREVVLPHAARDLVTAQIKGAELDLRNRELLGRRVLRRIVLRQLLVLEHVQQRRLAGIVQAQEENLGVFVRQAEIVKRRPHPIEEEHGGKRAKCVERLKVPRGSDFC